ncbi:hypothetical protein G9C85_09845 [Halorubellus sp. JP-L1]|uniref:hypothetical protein n=1 Tax=Halorubellus sp. JP-L1 TaxID=2715753 RepID=UPI00140CD352|nr:hypothetical protein [Halorubellus sp. JP-L1]NHN41928.1 hypothetical protein [Halorubellus sp. JP-L1]
MARGGDDHDRNRVIRALSYFLVALVVTPAVALLFKVGMEIALLMAVTLGFCLVVTTFVLASLGI